MDSLTPFERYLQHNPQESDPELFQHQYESELNDTTEHSPIHFQIPQFMMFGPPTLAPGGGAEVLPPSMFASPHADSGSAWLSNNIFSHQKTPEQSNPRFATEQSPAPMSLYTHSNSFDNTSNHTYPVDPNPPSTQAQPQWSADQPDVPGPFAAPSAFGLPVYSTSGFDILSIMARVVTRPNPTLTLGPVDMSCSFVIVDVRRHDTPVVYVSPTFCALTGYEEREVLGRNCRFLQAPDGCVQKGEERRYTSPTAVAHLKKSLVADKECQTSLINYRKGGSAFINLISVIPIPGGATNAPEEADQVAYHIGFQVDLTEQPNAILDRVRGGTYVVNYTHNPISRNPSIPNTVSRDRRANTTSAVVPLSKQLRSLLADDKFINSIPLSTSTTLISATVSAGDKNTNSDSFDGNQYLSMLLLESSPDFIHVLSLRGSFLYVGPSVRRVLGYSPEDVVGKSISDYCHPADLVPLMRELKESSATPAPDGSAPTHIPPRAVDLLFRIMSKSEGYVWMESRGRLYVEPGKGRKAIILSGRKRAMPTLAWGSVTQTGGLVAPTHGRRKEETTGEREFWGTLNRSSTFLFVGAAIRDVLGWGVGEIIGKRLEDFICVPADASYNPCFVVQDAVYRASTNSKIQHSQIVFDMQAKDGNGISITMILYHTSDPAAIPPEPVICQFKMTSALNQSVAIVHPSISDVFEEMNTSRNTSWQYELQQLKFANQRLLDEVQALESRAPRSRLASGTY